MNSIISKLLYPLGITANYTGYYYMAYAIELASQDPSRLVLVTKNLYPAVAVHFSTTTGCVEHSLRRTAALAWATNRRFLQELAGHALPQRPCASQFVAILSAQYKKTLTIPRSNGQQSFF